MTQELTMTTEQHDLEESYMISDMIMSLMGVDHMAYIKPTISKGGEEGFTVFSADGTELATFETKEAAYYTAKQHNLEPVNLH